jgi:hypothetical protein
MSFERLIISVKAVDGNEKELFIERVKDESFTFIKNSTVQLYYANLERERPEANGSGTLFNFNGKKCIVTAAHVVMEGATVVTVYASPGTNGEDLFILDNDHAQYHVPKDLLGLPTLAHDLALIELDDTLSSMFTGKRFMDWRNISTQSIIPPDATYAVAGFPCSRTKLNPTRNKVTNQFLYFITNYKDAVPTGADPFPQQHQVCFRYDKKDLFEFDNTKSQLGPELLGVSGGGIWIICPQKVVVEDWNPQKYCRLVAVATDQRPDRTLVGGTRSSYVGAFFTVKNNS